MEILLAYKVFQYATDVPINRSWRVVQLRLDAEYELLKHNEHDDQAVNA